jgi:CcmD family protein
MRDSTSEVQAQTPEGFVAGAQTAATETLPATPLVYIAYSGIWLVLLLYVLMLWRRLQRVEKDLQQVSSGRPGADRR